MEWRGGPTSRIGKRAVTYDGHAVVKEETLPDGRRKLILSDKDTGSVFDLVTSD
jgi:YD repeat-containing protein